MAAQFCVYIMVSLMYSTVVDPDTIPLSGVTIPFSPRLKQHRLILIFLRCIICIGSLLFLLVRISLTKHDLFLISLSCFFPGVWSRPYIRAFVVAWKRNKECFCSFDFQ